MSKGALFRNHKSQGFWLVTLLLFSPASFLAPHLTCLAFQAVSEGTLRVDVDLVTIEVVAIDKKGKLVLGMEKEDFRLFQAGKEQPLISFDRVQDRAEPGKLSTAEDDPKRRTKLTLILFDDSNITPTYTRLARDLAEHHVKEHMHDGDLFGVAVYEHALKVTQNFTQDATKVIEAIQLPATSLSVVGARRPLPEPRDSLNTRDSVNTRDSLNRRRRPAAASVDPNYSGGPDPESQARMAQFLRSLTELSKSVAAVKGRKSVILFTEDRLLLRDFRSKAHFYQAATAAQESNLVFYTLDTAEQKPASESILATLAQETGGQAAYNTTDLGATLDGIESELSNYYVLGFYPFHSKSAKETPKMEVKTKLGGVALRYRKTYKDTSPVDVLAGSPREQLLLGRLSSAHPSLPPSELPLSLKTAYFYDSPNVAQIAVAARIARGSLALKKNGTEMMNSLNIMGVVFAEDGTEASRFSDTVNIVLPKDQGEDFRHRDFLYDSSFKLRPGQYRLRLAVADDRGKVGTAEHLLSVPAYLEKSLTSSSLIVSQRIRPLPHLIQNLQTQLLEESDPLVFSGVQIGISVDPRIDREVPVTFFYKLYNLDGQDGLTAKTQLVDDRGKIYAFPPLPLDKAKVASLEQGQAAIGYNLSFKNVQPGKYKLIVVTSSAPVGQSATCHADVIVE